MNALLSTCCVIHIHCHKWHSLENDDNGPSTMKCCSTPFRSVQAMWSTSPLSPTSSWIASNSIKKLCGKDEMLPHSFQKYAMCSTSSLSPTSSWIDSNSDKKLCGKDEKCNGCCRDHGLSSPSDACSSVLTCSSCMLSWNGTSACWLWFPHPECLQSHSNLLVQGGWNNETVEMTVTPHWFILDAGTYNKFTISLQWVSQSVLQFKSESALLLSVLLFALKKNYPQLWVQKRI